MTESGPESGDRDAVEAFWAALHQTLQSDEVSDGWTERARNASAAAMAKVRADLARGWGDQADYASRHLMRSLDLWGVDIYGKGRLIGLAREAQEALVRLRPNH